MEWIAAVFFVIAHIFNGHGVKRTQVDNQWWFYEINPLLGKHPTTSRIVDYFTVTGFVALAALFVLPTFWSSMLLFGYGMVNVALGIRDFYLLGKVKHRPDAPRGVRLIFEEE